MWFWTLLEKFLDFGMGVNKIVDKSLPSAEMSKEIYDDKRAVTDGKRMQKVLTQATTYLFFHLKYRREIDTYVDFKHKALTEAERTELKRLLHAKYDKKK